MDINVSGSAVAVIENIRNAKLARQRDETQRELEIIQQRIKHTMEDYELGQEVISSSSNIEFVNDLKELEAILSDNVLKTKYQQKISIFIVGFEDICSKRQNILAQLFEFFDTYAAPFDEAIENNDEEIDLDSAQSCVNGAIGSMENAVGRLGDLNHAIMSYLGQMQAATASKNSKSRKKIEKAMQLAKNDLLKMTDKLVETQQALAEKEDTLKIMNKQLDNKNKEILKFKVDLEGSKRKVKAAQDLLSEAETKYNLLTTETEFKTQKYENEIAQLKSKLEEIETTGLSQIKESFKAELVEMCENVKTMDFEETITELHLHYMKQLGKCRVIHQDEIDDLTETYKRYVLELMEIDIPDDEINKWGGEKQAEEISPQDDAVEQKDKVEIKTDAEEDVGNIETTELSAHIEATEEEKDSTLQKEEAELSALDVALDNEDYWSSVLDDELKQKFAEYRAESLKQIQLLRDNQNPLTNENHLKEEQARWATEREVFIKHIEQMKALQEAAEADAEEAMQQLEDLARIQEEEDKVRMMQERVEEGEGQHQPVEEDTNIREAVSDTEDSEVKVESSTVTNSVQTQHAMQELTVGEQTPLSSTSKRSIASLVMEKVEEKRAARLRRQESLSQIIRSAPSRTSSKMDAYQSKATLVQTYEAIVGVQRRVFGDQHITSGAPQLADVLAGNTSDGQIKEGIVAIATAMENALHKTQDGGIRYMTTPLTPFQRSRMSNIDAETEMLRTKVAQLERDLETTRFDFEQRVRRDSKVIDHLQGSLSTLQQRSIDANQVPNPTPSAPTYQPLDGSGDAIPPPPQTSASNMTVLFTRLDTERNAKSLKKSHDLGKITQGTVESLVATMAAYNEIPGMRLRHLASKLVHHMKMKTIEMNVRNSNLVTSEVFAILEKMEALQRHRATEWSRQMDELSKKRRRLALLLQDALQRLEKTSGVFLIKPILSYKGQLKVRRYSGKISTRYNKYQTDAQLKQEKANLLKMSSESRYRRISGERSWRPNVQSSESAELFSVVGLAQKESPQMWNKDLSLPQSSRLPNQQTTERRSPAYNSAPAAFPKILELDVNRYLHEVNTIVTTSPAFAFKTGSQGSLRTYTGISRAHVTTSPFKSPAGPAQTSGMDASPNESAEYQSTAPPTTPASMARRGSTNYSPGVNGTPLPQPLPPIIKAPSQASMRNFAPSPLKNITPRNTPSPEKSPAKRSSIDIVVTPQEAVTI